MSLSHWNVEHSCNNMEKAVWDKPYVKKKKGNLDI